MKKIVLIENSERFHIQIKSAMYKKFGDDVLVYPTHINGDKDTYDYNGYLIQELIGDKPNFEAVLEYYKDTDLFIIDVSLVGDRSYHGLDFCKFLVSRIRKNFKIIVISNNRQQDDILGQVKFMSKFDLGRYFVPDLVKEVQKMLQLDAPAQDKEQKQHEKEPDENSIEYKLHRAWRWLRYEADRAIDKIIFIVFYALAAGAAVYAGLRIWSSLFDPAKDQNQLTTAEEIFISLLPLFIVLGFFKYYRQNVRVTLLGGGIDKDHEDSSTRTMNLAKILFISSITSYTIIKVLEAIFEAPTIDIPKLVAAGIFLLILMTYFLILDKKRH